MKGVKDAVMELAQHLSTESTWDEAMYKINVLQKIERGLKDADEGRTIAQEVSSQGSSMTPIRWTESARADLRAIGGPDQRVRRVV